ncbi:hypothetical protein IMSHALPRED_000878 [Imshaugia aleurites]|uniref:Uncharacterized protein n=1 Tax=Imshaugia aleurites TaxID=172621 RepID=A0A8H3ET71_9LECA|nr:hypothetical protein IMSHALPRED_000878 [Imshaugia aleurites]
MASTETLASDEYRLRLKLMVEESGSEELSDIESSDPRIMTETKKGKADKKKDSAAAVIRFKIKKIEFETESKGKNVEFEGQKAAVTSSAKIR